MAKRGTRVGSSVGKKFISGFTGLCLVAFLLAHLIGNFLIYAGPDAFNGYAHFLENAGHGVLIYAAEAGLLVFFALHIVSGVQVFVHGRSARDEAYYKVADAGGRSRKSLSSRSMIVTGIVTLLFVVIHIRMFKFGSARMISTAHGMEVRDLYTLVVTSFKDPVISLFYTAVIVLLGMHLRHGVWSSFQSLGIHHPRHAPYLYVGGITLAILLAIGFALFPIMVFFFFQNPATWGGV